MKGPIFIHVITEKGRGYEPARQDPGTFHGVGPFDISTGKTFKKAIKTYTEIFGEYMVERARTDSKLVTITAAMANGTGLSEFACCYPERFFDTGICEQHAVTLAAGMAKAGLRPVVAIYSTFLQRAYDQIIHDVALQRLPVIFAIDRAGLVGEDGPTHHGVFDLAYLRSIPELTLMAPSNENELLDMLHTAFTINGPVAIRYPRGAGERKEPVNCNITITPFDASGSDWSVKIIVIQEMERINRLIRNYSGNSARVTFDDIVGTNPQFLNTLYHAKRSAGTRSNILLLGESGVGKDVLAQAIHNESPRRNGPFIAINCAALPRELIASELFGYEEGAFTGARRGGNLGKFELAHQGTIFLDEIGDMPLDSQAMLLRVIEEKTIVRLGGSKSIPVNVRIIAATNKDLQAEVENNTFRRDLFYRLGVIKIIIPPLRERTEDIAILSQHFLSVLCRRFNLPKKTLSPEVLYAFQNYSWPGNIRELQNILESAVQWSVSPIISKNQIEQLLPAIKPSQQVSIEKIVDPEEPLELKQIKACLAKYDNNKSKTAKALGISRKTLYKRLDKYGLSSS
jgi:DNA-binding NtrC family response regulator